MRSTMRSRSAVSAAPTCARMASMAPLLASPPSRISAPLMRVSALNGTKLRMRSWSATSPYFCSASATIDRPSGVSSLNEASSAASANSLSVIPGRGTNSSAMRPPKVIVPVLSRRIVPTLPAASTAEPDFAITLASTSRLIPAMPTAERIPAVVARHRARRGAQSEMPPNPALRAGSGRAEWPPRRSRPGTAAPMKRSG